jgi:hypothetical protein
MGGFAYYQQLKSPLLVREADYTCGEMRFSEN